VFCEHGIGSTVYVKDVDLTINYETVSLLTNV